MPPPPPSPFIASKTMGLRTFTAPDGNEWRVWKVIPTRTMDDMREGERRGQDVLAHEGPERRVEDRRAEASVPFVSPALAFGWLCFEAATGKRRLAPPPPAWEHVPESELVALWEEADVVPPRAKRARAAAQPA